MIVTLLTDFGTRDTYVGVMKGVIKGIAPGADIVDLTHAVPPQDIGAGAFALKTACRYFPPGTVHLAVVDPGVGGARRPIAARIGAAVYVCPDNGLLSYVLAEERLHDCVVLNHTQYHLASVSRTFHGRDIFAPVAAALALGAPLEAVGTHSDTLTTFPLSTPSVVGDTMTCHVIADDTFGNVFADISEDIYRRWTDSGCRITVGGQDVPGPMDSYSDVPMGSPVALFGSSGHLEIAVRDGSARALLGLQRGDSIILHKKA